MISALVVVDIQIAADRYSDGGVRPFIREEQGNIRAAVAVEIRGNYCDGNLIHRIENRHAEGSIAMPGQQNEAVGSRVDSEKAFDSVLAHRGLNDCGHRAGCRIEFLRLKGPVAVSE